MRHYIRNAVIIVALIVISVMSITPPEKKLRLGRDLAGGVNVVYQVDVRPDESASEVLDKVIQVVHERLDPKGLLEISIVAQGNDRIEISMPLASPEVKALQAKFEEELAKLSAGSINAEQVDAANRAPAGERPARLEALAGGEAARLDLLKKAAEAFDAMETQTPAYTQQKEKAAAARTRYEDAKKTPESVGGPDFVELLRLGMEAENRALDDLAAKLADAEIAYEGAREKVLASVVSPLEVRRALRLQSDSIKVLDDKTGEIVRLDSPRTVAMERLKTQHPTAAPAIERVEAAWNTYEATHSTLNDPGELIRLLKGAGVLTFRITVDPRSYSEEARAREQLHKVGPLYARTDQARWFKINKIQNWYSTVAEAKALQSNPAGYFTGRGYVVEEYDGEYYMLAWDRAGVRLTPDDGQWALTSARQGQDPLGRPAIDFQMDRIGADRMGTLTENNINNRMAVLLDDEVYTAPNINGRIAGHGQIMGDFSTAELQYIIRVLGSGSLQAKLSPEPISVSTIAPELGADNLRKALVAGVIAFSACAVFMVVYYFASGLIAILAMILSGLFIIAAMAIQDAAFSLPGIAGVVLTFGQAVDSNVLVYERMREEFHRGADMRTAVRHGFERALPPIVDGNISNLIICIVLGFFGTQEIRGFAVTLGIGVVTTLFASLFMSRFLFTVLVERFGWRRTSQLPMTFPFVQRLMTPHVNWMKHRHVLLGILIVFLALSAVITIKRGPDLLGMEFRGGTAVTMTFRQTPGPDGKPVQTKLTRAEVEKRVRGVAATAPAGSPVKLLEEAQVIAVNPDADKVTSGTFTVKTLATQPDAIQTALLTAFSDMLESRPPSKFDGSDTPTPAGAPIFPIIDPVLGESINRPNVLEQTREFYGGAAIVLDNVDPPVRLADVEARLKRAREQAAFSDTAQHLQRVVVIEGTPESVKSAVVMVADPNVSYSDDPKGWAARVQDREWSLVKSALTETQTLAQVQSFSAAIARTFAAQGIICTLLSLLLLTIYVFARFGTLRWAIAATVPLFADVIGIVGLIAVAQYLHGNPATHALARKMGLLPFDLDLAQIAAILTIVGYSLNDKIIILDRIRENKGKLPYASYQVINDSINQTLSRTVITAGAHMITTIVLYLWGGEAVRGFAYTFNLGVLLGTFTSIVSTPLVWSGKADTSNGHSAGGLGEGSALMVSTTGSPNGTPSRGAEAAPAGTDTRTV